MILLGIAIAGGFGAIGRFIVDGLIRTLLGRAFPWGTLIINIVGSLLLGLLTGLVLYHHGDNSIKLIAGTGFCGGFTTFSTASFEAARFLEERRYFTAIFHLLAHPLLAISAAAGGLWLMR